MVNFSSLLDSNNGKTLLANLNSTVKPAKIGEQKKERIWSEYARVGDSFIFWKKKYRWWKQIDFFSTNPV